MVLRKKNTEYKPLSLPINKPFCELTHNETEALFQWFLSHISERIAYLSAFASETKFGLRLELDLSPTSLIPLWTWFLSVAEIERLEKKQQAECDEIAGSSTMTFSDYITNRSDKRLSLFSEYILIDIGIYLGQVFVMNHPGIKWTYYEIPRTDFFVNRPVLSGFEDRRFSPPFKMYFEPIHMASIQASKLIKHNGAKDNLYNLYREWVTHITTE